MDMDFRAKRGLDGQHIELIECAHRAVGLAFGGAEGGEIMPPEQDKQRPSCIRVDVQPVAQPARPCPPTSAAGARRFSNRNR